MPRSLSLSLPFLPRSAVLPPPSSLSPSPARPARAALSLAPERRGSLLPSGWGTPPSVQRHRGYPVDSTHLQHPHTPAAWPAAAASEEASRTHNFRACASADAFAPVNFRTLKISTSPRPARGRPNTSGNNCNIEKYIVGCITLRNSGFNTVDAAREKVLE